MLQLLKHCCYYSHIGLAVESVLNSLYLETFHVTYQSLSLCRPLASYNSLLDPHLSGYFSNTRMKRHLRKSGLVSESVLLFVLASYTHR